MNKTLEEMRAETDRYIKNITDLTEKIMFQVNTLSTYFRQAREVLTEEQLIERERLSKEEPKKGGDIL